MLFIGALTGWRFTLAAMLYGFAVAALMAVVIILKKRIARRTFGRIWRFFWLIFAPGGASDPATPESPKVPFGLALCVGAGISLIEAIFRGPVAERILLGW